MRTHLRTIGVALIVLLVAACGELRPGATVTFRPLNGPIKFAIDEGGNVTIKAGLDFVTPIGTFTVEANASEDPQNAPRPTETLFTLTHVQTVDDEAVIVDDLYRINANSGLSVTADGHIEIVAIGNRIHVDASDAEVREVLVVGPNYFERQPPIEAGRFPLATTYSTRDDEKWTLDEVEFASDSVRFSGRVENTGIREIEVQYLGDLGYVIQSDYIDNQRLSSTEDSFGSGDNDYVLTLARNQGRSWAMYIPNNGEFRYGESVYVWFASIGWQITLPEST